MASPLTGILTVQIVYTVEVGDSFLRALNRYQGKAGRAGRAEVRDWCIKHGSSLDEDIMAMAVPEDPPDGTQ